MVKTLRKVTARVHQGVGKVRRFTSGKFRKRQIERKLQRRHGECLRCGACCKLMFKCPMLLEHADGTTACRIHNHRPENCRLFPLDERCLRERDHLMPLLPCGYSFYEEAAPAEPKRA